MIYTVGPKEETDRDLEERASAGGRLYKMGMGVTNGRVYRGGLVWRTLEEAKAWIEAEKARLEGLPDQRSKEARSKLDTFEVYGVEADWDKHTMEYDEEPFRRLIVNKPMVKL